VPLLVCGTPIGNLEDVTLRVLTALRESDAVLCEDTRHTRVLLDRHGIRARELLSLHRHNEEQRAAELLPRLEAGQTLALVSDAGMPGIADPGARLVARVAAAGVEVLVLPGPSAVASAVAVSGLLGEGPFRFAGWVPRKEGERAALWASVAGEADPVVLFESPRRILSALASLGKELPACRVCVCRELTKIHETVVRGTPAEVAEALGPEPRGEIVMVLAAGPESGGGGKDAALTGAVEAVAELVAAGAPRKVAAGVVARLTGIGRNRLYDADL
jgi:16S rRNA (cytidine1402-2'-O)-methyltransferase